MIDYASKIVNKVYSKKRLSDTAGITYFKKFVLFIALLLALIYLGLIFAALQNSDPGYESMSYLFLAGAFTLITGMSLYECLRKSDSKFMSFDDLVQKELVEFFRQINA